MIFGKATISGARLTHQIWDQGEISNQCLLASKVTTVQATSALASLLTQDGHEHFCLKLIMADLATMLWLYFLFVAVKKSKF